jgi:hypothetical protein
VVLTQKKYMAVFYIISANKTVGRESRSGGGHYHPGGGSLPPQCGYSWQTQGDRCLSGTVLKEIKSSVGSAAVDELLCEYCENTLECVAWTQVDATTGHALGKDCAMPCHAMPCHAMEMGLVSLVVWGHFEVGHFERC